MAVLLLRHMESEKNIMNTFSSLSNNEVLTDNGIKYCDRASELIYDFAQNNTLSVNCIYCAKSIRAEMTANVLAKKFGIGIKSYEELCSNRSGNLRGKSEQEALKLNPIFMKQLSLFRAGIFSSYNFIKIYKREDKHDFEFRVINCVEKILLNDTGDLQIIVLHHSSLTATVINYARKYYNYPSDFYGHVACDLGNIYLVDNNDIILCNESPERLLSIKL
mgnify:FL=1